MLDWSKFLQLSGSPENNFELLCRGIIRNVFGQYGDFVFHSNMAGIEFYLDIKENCSLGSTDRCFGWQCKWYNISSGTSLGSTRKSSIEDAIKKTEKYFPQITDWVLWTKETLTSGDQEWFRSIDTKLNLHLNNSEDIEGYKNGAARVFCSTYFGELALRHHDLKNLNNLSISTIRSRWNHEIHQITEIEREVRKHLGCNVSWDHLEGIKNKVIKFYELLLPTVCCNDSIDKRLKEGSFKFLNTVREYLSLVNRINKLIEEKRFFEIIDLSVKVPFDKDDLQIPRLHRRDNSTNALFYTNLLGHLFELEESLEQFKEYMQERMIVISAEAGHGKTEFSAEITQGDSELLPGVVLHAKRLAARGSLSDLVKDYSVNGNSFSDISSLLQSLNSIGERENKRVTIVIDGLNESEDPRSWKDLISSLLELSKGLKNIFFILTIRPSFVEDAIPEEIKLLKSEGYGEDLDDAIDKYFNFYKINRTLGDVPRHLFQHPLTLKLFCEVTNPSRQNYVDVISGPQSLIELFNAFVDSCANRISELSDIGHRIYPDMVKEALKIYSKYLYENSCRGMEKSKFQELINDRIDNWQYSLLKAIESEGLLIRDKVGDEYQISPIYDAFGGHLIADYLTLSMGENEFGNWCSDAKNLDFLFGDKRNPLYEDICSSLVSHIPNRFYGKNFWEYLEGDGKELALKECLFLDKKFISQSTIEALKIYVQSKKISDREMLRFYYLLALDRHPFGVDFVYDCLSGMSPADRDILWTEWCRKNKKDFLSVLNHYRKKWYDSESISKNKDQNLFRYFCWILTTTDRELRDTVSHALFEFGYKKLDLLLNQTEYFLDIKDDYIVSRLIALSFGVITSGKIISDEEREAIKKFILSCVGKLIGTSATAPTDHMLIRDYFQKIVEYSTNHIFENESFVPDVNNIIFAEESTFALITTGDPREKDFGQAIRMDFENYTLGTLFKGRRNYDNNHQGHQNCLAFVRGLLWDYGWRLNELGEVDDRIYRYDGRTQRTKVERYGKKYSWIAYYKYAGKLNQSNDLPDRVKYFIRDDFEPSFLKPVPVAKSTFKLSTSIDMSDQVWMKTGKVDIPTNILEREALDPTDESWVLISAYYSENNDSKKVWGWTQTVFVENSKLDKVIKEFEGNDPFYFLDNQSASLHDFSAGEIPWSKKFSEALNDYEDYLYPSFNGDLIGEIVCCEFVNEKSEEWQKTASSYQLPTLKLINELDLKKEQRTLRFLDQENRVATQFLKLEGSCSGELFYIRKDLLKKYLNGRKAVQFSWGERELRYDDYNHEDWEIEIRQNKENVWKLIRVIR